VDSFELPWSYPTRSSLFPDLNWTTSAMADPFYSSCADVLSVCQANRENLDALLDPKTGFASRLRDLCDEQCVQPPSFVCETDPA
jgi:hypothetical protein